MMPPIYEPYNGPADAVDVLEGEAPSGLIYRPDFLSQQRIEDLHHSIEENLRWTCGKYAGGSAYTGGWMTHDENYSSVIWHPPDLLPELRSFDETMQEAGFSYGSPEQVTIQRYVPSGGIRPHVDRDVYGNLSFLSYGTPCVLTLEHLDGIQKTDLRIDPGSLYVLRRSARYDWKHGIAQGTQTFRGRVIEILDGSRRTSVCFRKRDPVQQEYMHVL